MLESVKSTPFFRTYANLNSAVVCATADPSGGRRHAVGFYVGGAGTVVIRPRGGDGSGDQTFTCAAGAMFFGETGIEFDRIVSGTATNVTVFWGR